MIVIDALHHDNFYSLIIYIMIVIDALHHDTFFSLIIDIMIVLDIGLCREPSSRPQDGSLRSRTGGFVDTRPRAVVGKQDGLIPVLGRAA